MTPFLVLVEAVVLCGWTVCDMPFGGFGVWCSGDGVRGGNGVFLPLLLPDRGENCYIPHLSGVDRGMWLSAWCAVL